MNWLTQMPALQPVAWTIVVLAAVIAVGLSIGSVRVRGFGLGIAGVLFAALAAGAAHLSPSAEILGFVRDFGLILFVYTIGMQVGPGFVTSLRRDGLPMNLLALSTVVLGAAVTFVVARIFGIDFAAAAGLFAGATTNTPALGATQEALRSLPGVDSARLGMPALGYAVAYPFGILGIIATMLGLRIVLRIQTTQELQSFERAHAPAAEPLVRRTLLVTNPNLSGLHLHELPGKLQLGIIISRVRYAGEDEVRTADSRTVIHPGDVLLAVGKAAALDEFQLIVGRATPEDLLRRPGNVVVNRVVVTNGAVLGHSLRDLLVANDFAVAITRVTRADVEMTAVPDLKLQFGDTLMVVGTAEEIQKVAGLLGNSVKDLSYTNLIPVFLGVLAGVILGLYPVHLPGLSAPVRLGLAGGPLIAAIVLSRIGRIGPLVWHMPANANTLLRELGITLFLACAGLGAGEHFGAIIVSSQGPLWFACGALITLVPLLVVGLFARLFLKLNFISLCGLLAGSMTDPPALAFANSLHKSDAPAVAYATVYPFTMLLRVLTAQLLVLLFCR